MKVSYNWIKKYFDTEIPEAGEIARLLTTHSFEIESVIEKGGDFVLDAKVMPDRAHDCLSHRGIAREISVLTEIPLNQYYFISDISVPESNILKVEVVEGGGCRRFSSVFIEDVEVGESPKWLKNFLEAIGQRSINNIVDITNFVMFSTGQPLHAYDASLLSSSGDDYRISVRKAKANEKVFALDQKEYSMIDEDLLISDGNSNVALGIAGIKGGISTQISNNTKNIILESANFEPVGIRKTAKRLGLRTDASARFENDITPSLTTKALNEAVNLIFDLAKNSETKIEGMIDVWGDMSKWTYTIGISAEEVNSLLGLQMDEEEIGKVLKKLQFPFSIVNPIDAIKEAMPKVLGKKYKNPSIMRKDAPEYFSCSSLVSYIFNYAGVWMPSISVDKYAFVDEIQENDLQFGDLIFSNTGNGKIHFETIEYMSGLKVPEGIDHVGIYVGNGEVLHANSLDGDVRVQKLGESDFFKNIVGYGRVPVDLSKKRFVVEIPNERLDLRIKEDLIEEIGRIYGYENLKSDPIDKSENVLEINKLYHYCDVLRNIFINNGFSEVITYAFRNKGNQKLLNPLANDKAFLRNSTSAGLAESLEINFGNAELLGLQEIREFEIGNVFEREGESTAVAFAIKKPKTRGGKSADDEAKEIIEKINSVLGAELNFEKMGEVYEAKISIILEKLSAPDLSIQYGNMSTGRYKIISQYPFVLRDIAVFVPEGTTSEELLQIIESKSGELLVRSRLFDEFKKDGKISFAFRLVFQSKEKTLTDDEVNKIMNEVSKEIENKGWQVR